MQLILIETWCICWHVHINIGIFIILILKLIPSIKPHNRRITGRSPTTDPRIIGRSPTTDWRIIGRSPKTDWRIIGRSPKTDWRIIGRSPKTDPRIIGRSPKTDWKSWPYTASYNEGVCVCEPDPMCLYYFRVFRFIFHEYNRGRYYKQNMPTQWYNDLFCLLLWLCILEYS